MARVIVVGAGLAGLAAGFRLREAGHEVIVLERNAMPGGSARTERHGSYLIDTGPDALNTGYTRYVALAHAVGLGERIVPCSQAIDVIRDGQTVSFNGARPSSLIASRC